MQIAKMNGGGLLQASKPERQHIAGLDGLRGLAACIVVVSHISNMTNLWGGALGRGGGQIGVMLFFVLSGYLMGLLYLDRTFSRTEVWNYAVRRVARVLPLFYAVAVGELLLEQIGRLTGSALQFYQIDDPLLLLTLVQGTDVFWTIPIEIQFYAIFVAVWAFYSLWARGAIVTTIIGAAVLFILTRKDSPGLEGSTSGLVTHYVPFFACGLSVSHYLPRNVGRLLRPWPAVLAASFPLFLLTYPQIATAAFGVDIGLWNNPLCLALAVGCLIATVSASPASSVLSTRPMRHLGKVSYSLYLLHQPVLLLLDSMTQLRHWPELFLVVGLALAIAVATVVQRFFEAPTRHAINERLTVTLVD
jgi:peptidoglycan/LPS O-acetylase OafA/YrhL